MSRADTDTVHVVDAALPPLSIAFPGVGTLTLPASRSYMLDDGAEG